jgi:lysophospholipase L1-like esterase
MDRDRLGERGAPGGRRAAAGILANLALVLASVLLALGALELGLRLVWQGYYLKTPKGYAAHDPIRGWRNLPGATVDYGEPEFSTVVVHDSHGFRGPEVPLAKPPGKFRILVLGDSFTYGVGVENDETFSARLGQLDPRLEVINAGVIGYGTSQELVLLQEQGLPLRPDLVLVAFFWNDVANSYVRGLPPFAVENGALRYPPADARVPERPRRPDSRRLLRHSYAYRFLSDRLKMLSFQAKLALELPIEDDDRLAGHDPEAAWQLTALLLSEIQRSAQAAGASTLVALIPDQVQVQPDLSVTGLRPENYEIQDRMRALAAAHDIAVLDLLPGMRDAYQSDGVPLYYRVDRHFNARGHQLAAKILLEELLRRGYLPAAGLDG